jgi:hypothetical protein
MDCLWDSSGKYSVITQAQSHWLLVPCSKLRWDVANKWTLTILRNSNSIYKYIFIEYFIVISTGNVHLATVIDLLWLYPQYLKHWRQGSIILLGLKTARRRASKWKFFQILYVLLGVWNDIRLTYIYLFLPLIFITIFCISYLKLNSHIFFQKSHLSCDFSCPLWQNIVTTYNSRHRKTFLKNVQPLLFYLAVELSNSETASESPCLPTIIIEFKY